MSTTEPGAAVDGVHRMTMPTIEHLDELALLVERCDARSDLYVRWSEGPAADIGAGDNQKQSSRDGLTGIMLPRLSANPLRVEPW
jgi:hypothetical protein